VCPSKKKKKKEKLYPWLLRAVDEKPNNPPPNPPKKIPETGTEKKIEIRG